MTTANEILNGMARAFFASAWADQCEEAAQSRMLSGRDIMDLMPAEIDPAALHAAQTLATGMIRANWPRRALLGGVTADQGLRVLYRYAESLPRERAIGGYRLVADRELTPELFGHYCAMQAMGHGVGLESFGHAVRDTISVPYVEFGSYSLEKDYFNVVDEDEVQP